MHDIVANALRRAEGQHYDDAVSRLYSALEKAAKVRLASAYGIDTSNTDLELIEDSDLRKELAEKCLDPRDNRIKLPLHRSYLLLRHFGDALGASYAARETDLRKLLEVRNMSLLAHGFHPVKEETFTAMLHLTMEFLDVPAEQLPHFPKLDEEAMGRVLL